MWAEVEALLQQGIADDLFPGAALCVRTEDTLLHAAAFGQAEVRPRPRPALTQTPWDLASITKVLGATPAAMRMVDSGALDLSAPIQLRLPHAPPGVTAAHCLSHASGLPAWRRLFADLPDQAAWGSEETRAAALRRVASTALQAPPGQQHTYSDLGMMLLCALLEHIGGDRFDRLWAREVGRHAPGLSWGAGPEAAATEDCPVRGRVLVGEVHDLNAAVLGGASTHAGLFGSAEAAAGAAAWQLRAWLGEAGEGLNPEVVRRFWSFEGAGSHRLGWDSPTPGSSSAGSRWPLDGVGHTGFTGGWLWIAPRQRIAAVVCTNRVHPEVEGGAVPGAAGPRTAAFRALRPRIFSAITRVLDAQGKWSL